ncbi:hypothetical protein AZE42_01774 [Rhizopogon vesiculosus]|uniref:Uncharacterized protein n=1 Tax=Rhizopogon vesiculosus TaxID=180088 RepID=A0A1J8QYQ6_9AGAM|nr:hypothetical protein AZE42_01774 [Rhizopogon vesiculosus]
MRSYKTSRAASIPVPLVILSPFTNMSTNVVAADIDRIGVENILAQNPFLGGDIAGTLRLEDRSTGERLYRLFITSLICRRGGYIPLHDLGTPAKLSTYLFINNNTSFNGSPLSSPVKSFLGAPVPAGLTFSTVHDLWLLSKGHPGVLICPSDDTIVPGVDAVIFQNDTLYLMQFNYYTPRAISYDVLRFMRKATHNTIYQPSRTHPWIFVVGYVDHLDERGFPTLLPHLGSSSNQEDVDLHGLLESSVLTRALRLDGVGKEAFGSQLSDLIYDVWGIPYKSCLRRSSESVHIATSARSKWRYEPGLHPRVEIRKRQEQLSLDPELCQAINHRIQNQRVATMSKKWFMAVEADMATLGGSPSSFVTCFVDY